MAKRRRNPSHKRTMATCKKCHVTYDLANGGYSHHARVSLIHHAALKRKKRHG